MPKPIVMTEKMKAGTQARLAALQMAQATLTSYVNGCSDTLGLEGNWNFDATTFTFTKKDTTKEAEKCPST